MRPIDQLYIEQGPLPFIVPWSSTDPWLKIFWNLFFFIRYGDIFHINIGKKNIVYLCDLETMEFVGKQDKFSFRENGYKKGSAKFLNWIFGFKNVHDKPGIVLSSGKNWQEQRRFALRNLKDLGLGKDYYIDGQNSWFVLKKCPLGEGSEAHKLQPEGGFLDHDLL